MNSMNDKKIVQINETKTRKKKCIKRYLTKRLID